MGRGNLLLGTCAGSDEEGTLLQMDAFEDAKTQ